MRHATKVLLLVLMALIAATAAWADDEAKEEKKLDGKELYKAECKPCHMEGSENEEYTPMSLIADQWDEFFDEYYVDAHKDVPSLKDEKKKVTEVLTDEMLELIRKFCVDHAADSEHPMTCG